jgi:asparagine synthase (glutamine-hydrolysing)
VCGIAGIAGGRTPITAEQVAVMGDALRHRGPDGRGTWCDGRVGLAHQRLAVLDLSDAAAQPMRTADGRHVLVYNGEVYNWRELRRELEACGYVFRTHSDTEVVLQALAEWGEAAIPRFNGMFALAWWDAMAKRLLLTRDRYGIKPLYLHWDGARVRFASEVKALLRDPALRVSLDREALGEYLTFQNIFSDRTLFRGVQVLPRATTWVWYPGRAEPPVTRRWWDYTFAPGDAASPEAHAEELDRLLRQSLVQQRHADVEIGAYLSGGVDSGAITGIAATELATAGGGRLRCFTAGFDLIGAAHDELHFDERARAQLIAAHNGAEHYQVVVTPADIARVLPSLVWHLEDLRVGQSYPNYCVAALASRFVKVVFAGTGADEIFAGYPWRYYPALRHTDPEEFIAQYYAFWQRLVPDARRDTFFTSTMREALSTHPPEAMFRAVLAGRTFGGMAPDDYVNASLYFELATFLPGLLLVEDKLSMAHGLETRLPFLDNALVDFALRVPVRHKLRHVDRIVRMDENTPGPKAERFFHQTGDGKVLLRRALARYAPPGYSRGRKQGFSAPDRSWFRNQTNQYVRSTLLGVDVRLHEFCERRAVEVLLAEHESGQVNHRLLIWSLLCLESWLRIFRDGEPVTAAPPRLVG